MSTNPSALDPLAITDRVPRPARNRFFLGMTLAMAAVVLAGFTPTLFGRAAFNVPKMPAYLYLHGLTLTARSAT
jgi:hypothetical protein